MQNIYTTAETWEQAQARRIRNLEQEEHALLQRLERVRSDLAELRNPVQ